jgi:hypothetical protein
MSEYQHVRYEVEKRVARITLNRPRYRNAQSRVLLEELDQAFLRADRDRGVNVIVLLGEGEHFSAGHDLGTPEEMEDREARPWQEGIRGWYDHTYENFFANTMRWRNNAQDAQGFPAHMKASHAFYCLSRMGESDPDAPQVETGARRRPMVQIALDNYHRHLKQPDES